MIIIAQPNATEEQIEEIVARVHEFGLEAHITRGESRVIVGVSGPETALREKPLAALPGVEAVLPAANPYNLAAYATRGAASTVDICGVSIGGDAAVTLICGPCSVETREQMLSTARLVKDCGARVLRGGAFKPRTSPYSFQGLREDGLRFLAEARNARAGARTILPAVPQAAGDPGAEAKDGEIASVRALLAALVARDGYTGDNCEKVVCLASEVARGCPGRRGTWRWRSGDQ